MCTVLACEGLRHLHRRNQSLHLRNQPLSIPARRWFPRRLPSRPLLEDRLDSAPHGSGPPLSHAASSTDGGIISAGNEGGLIGIMGDCHLRHRLQHHDTTTFTLPLATSFASKLSKNKQHTNIRQSSTMSTMSISVSLAAEPVVPNQTCREWQSTLVLTRMVPPSSSAW